MANEESMKEGNPVSRFFKRIFSRGRRDVDSDEVESEGFLNQLFGACAEDPKGSVHKAWGISLIFVVIYFVVSVVEMVNIQATGGSKALVIAAVWTGIVHVLLGVTGTFVLKRFPTSFSVGFFMGVLVVLANQNLILFGTFHGYDYGLPRSNHAFANLCLTLFMVMVFFTLLLFHFKRSIVVAPIDAKGMGRTSGQSDADYQQYGGSSAAA